MFSLHMSIDSCSSHFLLTDRTSYLFPVLIELPCFELFIAVPRLTRVGYKPLFTLACFNIASFTQLKPSSFITELTLAHSTVLVPLSFKPLFIRYYPSFCKHLCYCCYCCCCRCRVFIFCVR